MQNFQIIGFQSVWNLNFEWPYLHRYILSNKKETAALEAGMLNESDADHQINYKLESQIWNSSWILVATYLRFDELKNSNDSHAGRQLNSFVGQQIGHRTVDGVDLQGLSGRF